MKTKEQEIFQPFVTLEEVLAYRSERPDSWTRSELMNAFCRAVERLGAAAYKRLAAPRIGEEKQRIIREFEKLVEEQKD